MKGPGKIAICSDRRSATSSSGDWLRSLGLRDEFPGDKHQGIVNKLAWSADGAWILGAGGAGEGFLTFLDGKTKGKVAEGVHSSFVPPPRAIWEMLLRRVADGWMSPACAQRRTGTPCVASSRCRCRAS